MIVVDANVIVYLLTPGSQSELAMSSGCSAYACEFVSLAENLGVRLVASDGETLTAFPERAVDLRAYAAGN